VGFSWWLFGLVNVTENDFYIAYLYLFNASSNGFYLYLFHYGDGSSTTALRVHSL